MPPTLRLKMCGLDWINGIYVYKSVGHLAVLLCQNIGTSKWDMFGKNWTVPKWKTRVEDSSEDVEAKTEVVKCGVGKLEEFVDEDGRSPFP